MKFYPFKHYQINFFGGWVGDRNPFEVLDFKILTENNGKYSVPSSYIFLDVGIDPDPSLC